MRILKRWKNPLLSRMLLTRRTLYTRIWWRMHTWRQKRQIKIHICYLKKSRHLDQSLWNCFTFLNLIIKLRTNLRVIHTLPNMNVPERFLYIRHKVPWCLPRIHNLAQKSYNIFAQKYQYACPKVFLYLPPVHSGLSQ